jgi:alkylation response protein AidB-like acyl-CoA dehydrogenase
MRFALSEEQRRFGATLHELLAAAEVPAAARAWADGDHEPGLAIWAALAQAGVTALMVPEEFGGLGASPVDLVVACEELGHHPVPGPLAESVAAGPALLGPLGAGPVLAALAAGEAIATLAAPPLLPLALDADIAQVVMLAENQKLSLGQPKSRHDSMDPSRRLYEIEAAQELAAERDLTAGLRYGTLASAGLLLGAGRGLLDEAVRHARTREQFGHPVGSFQAVKHALADVLIAVDFARPLLYAAAIAVRADSATASRDVSAARVACADAARLAARTALQVHGAIGYTRECDVSLWLAKVRALSSAWGSQAEHRAAVLAALTQAETGPWN